MSGARVLVTGATGLVGSHAAARLARDGYAVRALVRDAAKLRRVMAPLPGGADVEPCVGDVCDAASVAAALDGCRGLVHSAGRFSHRREDATALRAVNVDGAKTVLEAGVKCGLERIVAVSSALALFPTAGPVQRASDPVTRPRGMYAATKAQAERHARALGATSPSLVIVYPSMVIGPHDPTVGGGPELMANALRDGSVLVTDGGLPYTDVRDLADLVAAIFASAAPPARLMSSAHFLPHDRYHALLCALTGRDLAARRVPGRLLRAMGRVGDVAERVLRRPVQLTSEAAEALTHMVPVDDGDARALLRREPTPIEDTLRDTLAWMHASGVLEARHVGRLARAGEGAEPTGSPARAEVRRA